MLSNPEHPIIDWTDRDERRMRQMVARMLPFAKIVAEFSEFPANAVRDRLAAWLEPKAAGVERALALLQDRAGRTKQGPGFFLDGRAVGGIDLVRAANRILHGLDQPSIAWPGI